MADKLMKYYQYVAEEVGLPGKMKVAQLTRIPSTSAVMAPDSPEIIQKFKDAIQQVTGKVPPSY